MLSLLPFSILSTVSAWFQMRQISPWESGSMADAVNRYVAVIFIPAQEDVIPVEDQPPVMSIPLSLDIDQVVITPAQEVGLVERDGVQRYPGEAPRDLDRVAWALGERFGSHYGSEGQTLLTYGRTLSSKGITDALEFASMVNSRLIKQGREPRPLCIWGPHGIGKTSIVHQYAKNSGMKFKYVAPAQFEELGDLHGLPTREGDKTVYLPPDWVPREPGPGILMLDDFNRADNRILQGLMQLLQFNGMFSWKLPPDWMIVCTANPEGGDYNVTPLDDAMITRLVHVAMIFDVREWAAWAMKDGLDTRVVAWVLAYPEIITGGRDTPRSVHQLADFTIHISDLTSPKGLEQLQTFGMGTLSETALASFVNFVTTELELIPTGRELLDAKSKAKLSAMIDKASIGADGAVHLDRIYILFLRLVSELTSPLYRQQARDVQNALTVLKHPKIPKDMSFMAFKWLAESDTPVIKQITVDPDLAMMLLDAM